MRERFQIAEITEQLNHAGTKANGDIAVIADRLGFRRVSVKMDTFVDSALGKARRQAGYFRDWKKARAEIPAGAVLLLQHPFHHNQLTREKTLRAIKEKQVKIISLVHDVEELRAYRFSPYYQREFDVMLELADVLIVHNERMKQWFATRGVSPEKMVSLEIFDYLMDDPAPKKPLFEKSLTVAGNLDAEKSGYIRMLGGLKGVKAHLYGPNFDQKLAQENQIVYHGSFPADEISAKLDRGFGLVWDGDSMAGCEGQSGQYLRYNNPHKLSLYLASGLPVVIWKDAAEAEFVEKHGVGILASGQDELTERLNRITEEEYSLMANRVSEIQSKLQTGCFGSNAIMKALALIEAQDAQ